MINFLDKLEITGAPFPASSRLEGLIISRQFYHDYIFDLPRGLTKNVIMITSILMPRLHGEFIAQ